MPEGVAVLVEDGFATIDFVDPATKGPGLAKLFEVGTPPEFVEKLSREKGSPRALYRVPEGNARAAKLIDKASDVDALEVLDTRSFAGDATGAVPPEFPTSANLHGPTVRTGAYADAYDCAPVEFTPDQVEQIVEGVAAELGADIPAGDGLPELSWSRKAIDDYAAALTAPIDTTGEKNKQDALAAITKAREGH